MPSIYSINGADNKNDMTVIIEKRFMSSSVSCNKEKMCKGNDIYHASTMWVYNDKKLRSKITSLSASSFLLITFRDWFVTLEAMALQNPILFFRSNFTVSIHAE